MSNATLFPLRLSMFKYVELIEELNYLENPFLKLFSMCYDV